MAHTCRGTINLANALIHTEDSTTIVISNGGAQTFHLKATSEVERQKWVTALELAKSEAIKMLEAGEFCFVKNGVSIDGLSFVKSSLCARDSCDDSRRNLMSIFHFILSKGLDIVQI